MAKNERQQKNKKFKKHINIKLTIEQNELHTNRCVSCFPKKNNRLCCTSGSVVLLIINTNFAIRLVQFLEIKLESYLLRKCKKNIDISKLKEEKQLQIDFISLTLEGII